MPAGPEPNPMCGQCRPSVRDAGPTLTTHWASADWERFPVFLEPRIDNHFTTRTMR